MDTPTGETAETVDIVETEPPAAVPQALRGDALIERIAAVEAEALGRALQPVLTATGEDRRSYLAITELVQSDERLHEQVMELAGEVAARAGNKARPAGVNQALMVLGFEVVRTLSVAGIVMHELERGDRNLGRGGRAAAQSLHGAIQAKAIALRRGRSSQIAERTFVDALLLGLGELMFWTHGGATADELDALLASGMEPAVAQERAVGLTMDTFNRRLLAQWRLPWHDGDDVRLGAAVAREAMHGWDSPELQAVAAEIAQLIGDSPAATRTMLRGNLEGSAFSGIVGRAVAVADAAEAQAEAERIAAEKAAAEARAAAQAKAAADAQAAAEAAAKASAERLAAEPVPAAAAAPEPGPAWNRHDDTELLRAFKDMLTHGRHRKDIPRLLSICLQGMMLGAGMDRVLFALRNGEEYRTRVAQGQDSDALRDALAVLPAEEVEAHLFRHGLSHYHDDAQVPRMLREVGLRAPCLVASVRTQGSNVGFFIADRGPSGRAIDPRAHDTFRLLSEQFEVLLRAMA